MKPEYSELQSLVADGSLCIVKSIFDDKIIDNIPIIQSIFAIKEVYSNIQNAMFLKRLNKYLATPYLAHSNEIDEFLKTISPTNHEKINDIIVHLLTVSEDVLKAVYLKRLIDSTIRKICTVEEAGYIAFIIQSVYVNDLDLICNELDGYSYNDDGFKERLHTLNVLERSVKLEKDLQNDPENIGVDYKLSGLGRLFIKCIFPDKYLLYKERQSKKNDIWEKFIKK